MSDHVMLDLETFGTSNEAAIASLGAVKFNADTILDRFHVGIDVEEMDRCGAYLGVVNPATVAWWMHPDRGDARTAWNALDKVPLYTALDGFAEWLGSESIPIWGNGSTFDNIILRNAFKREGLEHPCNFWHDYCYRTMKNMAPEIAIERIGTHHSAVDDAESQAVHLQKICLFLGVKL